MYPKNTILENRKTIAPVEGSIQSLAWHSEILVLEFNKCNQLWTNKIFNNYLLHMTWICILPL